MSKYLLILRDHELKWDRFLPDKKREIIDMYAEWNRKLREAEQFGGAGKLSRDLGVTVRARNDELLVDGPFSEAKEAIGGYYCVEADSLEDAIAAAKDCPILTYGGSVEVREMEGVLLE